MEHQETTDDDDDADDDDDDGDDDDDDDDGDGDGKLERVRLDILGFVPKRPRLSVKAKRSDAAAFAQAQTCICLPGMQTTMNTRTLDTLLCFPA